MRARHLLIALVLCSAAQAQRTTWIVDPAGSGHFTTLQAAVDAATSGDVVRLLRGRCGDLVTSKPIAIVGMADFTSEVGSITIQDLPADTEVVIDHVQLDYVTNRSMLFLRRCAGRIVLDNVRQWDALLNVYNGFFYFMDVSDCRDVTMIRCSSGGNRGAIVTDSNVTMDRCRFEPGPPHFPGVYGVSALDIVRSKVWLRSTTCVGNGGTTASGYGIRALDSEVRLGSGSGVNGANGFSRSLELNWSSASTAPDVSVSFVSLQSSSLVTIAMPTVQTAGTLGGTATASMQSDLGGVTLLALGENRTPLPIGRAGSLGLDLLNLTSVLGVGGTPLTLTLPIPNDPLLFGAAFGAQGCHLDANGSLWLSNRAPLVLL